MSEIWRNRQLCYRGDSSDVCRKRPGLWREDALKTYGFFILWVITPQGESCWKTHLFPLCHHWWHHPPKQSSSHTVEAYYILILSLGAGRGKGVEIHTPLSSCFTHLYPKVSVECGKAWFGCGWVVCQPSGSLTRTCHGFPESVANVKALAERKAAEHYYCFFVVSLA